MLSKIYTFRLNNVNKIGFEEILRIDLSLMDINRISRRLQRLHSETFQKAIGFSIQEKTRRICNLEAEGGTFILPLQLIII